MKHFSSQLQDVGTLNFPNFSGLRVMMLPIIIGNKSSLPNFLGDYKSPILKLSEMSGYDGMVGYVTIDEKNVIPGRSQRRPGKHVDGIYANGAGSWGGGSWGGGGEDPPSPKLKKLPLSPYGTGFLLSSTVTSCKAWAKEFEGWPDNEGGCEHLANQCDDTSSVIMEARKVYWADPLCVHEALPMQDGGKRQFIRLSLPSTAPWFEGYTENPLGIMPTGPILSSRPEEFMGYV